MNMLEQIRDGVYRIGVTLPQNPLRELNSYVICGDGRNLLIDTGFNRPECLEALQGGIRELGLDMECTDIFLTHLHSDHVGLASQVAGKGSRIYMNPIDNAGMNRFLTHPDGWGNQALRFLGEGFPPDELAVVKENNPGRKYRPNSVLEAIPVEDGTEIEVGGVRLKGIFTPGHTPGHTCLFCEEEGVLFTGDHVLFDITPNISIWEEMRDPLATYFVSLGKIAQLKVSLPLPARPSGYQHRPAGPHPEPTAPPPSPPGGGGAHREGSAWHQWIRGSQAHDLVHQGQGLGGLPLGAEMVRRGGGSDPLGLPDRAGGPPP